MPNTQIKYRLRRADRADDPRTRTYSTEGEANDALREIPRRQRGDWEIVPQPVSKAAGGVSTPSHERSKPIRSFTLSDETFALIQQIAAHLQIKNTGVVERAVAELAKILRIKQ
jgi:hypothetical protein